MWEICSNLAIKILKRRWWFCSGVFIVNFERISHIVSNEINDVALLSFQGTVRRLHSFFWCFNFWVWTSKCRMGRSFLPYSYFYAVTDHDFSYKFFIASVFVWQNDTTSIFPRVANIWSMLRHGSMGWIQNKGS